MVWYKIKNGKQTRIKKPKNIDKLLDKGYTVSQVVTRGNKSKVNTYSPKNYPENTYHKFGRSMF